MIRDNIARVLDNIAQVCGKIGRDPGEIVLVGVTKYAGAAEVKEAIQAGLKHIGENKVQDARVKFLGLEEAAAKVTRHMIGHLQTNKVKQALEIFDYIQSVDSEKLAAALETQAAKINKQIDILVQVNTSGEKQKSGVSPTGALPLIEQIARLGHVRLGGLMTIAPMGQDENVIRKCFADLRLLRDKVNRQFSHVPNIAMKYLSMGMTDDFKIALEEGSNMLRIGTAIFKN